MARTRVTSLRSVGRSTPRRQTEWIAATVNFTDLTASEIANVISFSQVALADLVPFTIIRTVGVMTVAFDTNFITNQIISGAAGLQVVGDDARASGVASMASPFADAADDSWFYHQFFHGVVDDRADSDILLSQSMVIDNPMKKLVIKPAVIRCISE